MNDPLRGRRVLVTRATAQAGGLSSALRAMGAEVIEVPLIAFKPALDQAAVRRSLTSLASYDLVLLTSANAARVFAAAATALGVSLGGPDQGSPGFIAIGPATAAAAATRGITARQVSGTATAESLAEALVNSVAGKRVLLPRAQVASEDLPRRLRRAGARVDVLPLYRTVSHPEASRVIPRLLGSRLDMVTFASTSAVRSFVAAAGPDFRRPQGLRIACIGPVTAQAARAAGLEPDVVAAEHTAAGLATAIAEHATDTAWAVTARRRAGAA